MDIETSAAFEEVRDELRESNRRIEAVDQRVGRTEAVLRAVIRESATELRGEIKESATGLREEIKDSGEQSRRFASVLTESLRDDIRMVAEAVVSLDAKVEAIRRDDRAH